METRDMARAMGSRGGRARAIRLSPEERQRIASLGGIARHRSLQVAQRIADNFRYVADILDLQGSSLKVVRMKAFTGRLPGIYPGR
jgi:hypothetical protein